MEKYSYSKLSTFHQCPYQYYLNYIERREGENNAFAEYGSFVHSILESYAKGSLSVFELLDKYKDEYIFNITKEFPYNKYKDLAESYYEDGIEFFSNFEGLEDYKILGVEDKFEEEINNDYILTGFIDLVLEDKDGNLILHDWKSKAGFKNKTELNKYAKQLYLYSIRLKRLYGKFPDKMQFGCFRKQETIQVDFSKEKYEEALKWMDDTVDKIRKCSSYEPKNDMFFCNNLCDFRFTCENK